MSLPYTNDTIAFVFLHESETGQLGDAPKLLSDLVNQLRKVMKQ